MTNNGCVGSSPTHGTNTNNFKFNKIMNNKRIFIVIEFNQYNAIAQGAFNTEKEAYTAMEAWKYHSNANWAVTSCTLYNDKYALLN